MVPCFNEAKRLDNAPSRPGARHRPSSCCSWTTDRDETAAVLDALCRRMSGSGSWLGLPRNQGKAEAVRLGMRHAIQMGDSVTGYLDADLATPLSEMARILKVQDELNKQVASPAACACWAWTSSV